MDDGGEQNKNKTLYICHFLRFIGLYLHLQLFKWRFESHNTAKEKVFIYVAREDDGWKLINCYTG